MNTVLWSQVQSNDKKCQFFTRPLNVAKAWIWRSCVKWKNRRLLFYRQFKWTNKSHKLTDGQHLNNRNQASLGRSMNDFNFRFNQWKFKPWMTICKFDVNAHSKSALIWQASLSKNTRVHIWTWIDTLFLIFLNALIACISNLFVAVFKHRYKYSLHRGYIYDEKWRIVWKWCFWR